MTTVFYVCVISFTLFALGDTYLYHYTAQCTLSSCVKRIVTVERYTAAMMRMLSFF